MQQLTTHSSRWLGSIHQTLTWRVLVYNFPRGTSRGKLSPNVGFRRSSTGLVQHAMLISGGLGNRAVLMYLISKVQNQKHIYLYTYADTNSNMLCITFHDSCYLFQWKTHVNAKQKNHEELEFSIRFIMKIELYLFRKTLN